MNNNNQPKRPPELQQPDDIIQSGENLNDDNLEMSGATTTFDLRQAADEAMAMYKNGGKVEADIDTTEARSSVFEKDMVLIFEIIGSSRILTLDIVQDIIVGRSDRTDNFSAGLDLTEFGAYQLGLSRKHARIRRSGLQLEVEDEGSRNGTFVNEQKIDPHVPYVIHDGDQIRFGNMKIQLRFAQKA